MTTQADPSSFADLFLDPEDDVKTPEVLAAEDKPPAQEKAAQPPLAALMPPGFDLNLLLTFVPDVQLKHDLDKRAKDLLALDLTKDEDFAQASIDNAVVSKKVEFIQKCFEYPASALHGLHKRVTGLRADFIKNGSEANAIMAKRIVAETRRRREAAEAEQREQQRLADEEERARAKAALEQAKQAGAAKEVIQELKQEAKTATAPTVPTRTWFPQVSGPRSTSVVEKWRCQIKGTGENDELNPEMAKLTTEQQFKVREAMEAVIDGKAPLTIFEINWSKLNKDAGSEKKTFSVPGFEALDIGGTRSR